MRALIVGRFQPYHLGHHQGIINVLKEVEELVIVVGSTQLSYELDDPFTTGERVEMISRALKAEGLYEKCFIIPVADVGEYDLWTRKIKSYCPHFDKVYTNNPVVKQLFEKDHIAVEKMMSNHKEIESTAVRKALIENKNWKVMLPNAVASYLTEIKAVERMHAILKDERKE